MEHFDHRDTNEAMFAALVVLNKLILALPECEETAKSEAFVVQKKLERGGLSTEQLTDLLHQAAIDYRVNTNQSALAVGEGNAR